LESDDVVERGTIIDEEAATEIIADLLEEQARSMGLVKHDAVIEFLRRWFA
jgi:hypothetical protein